MKGDAEHDRQIIKKALAYAIALSETLPPDIFEDSDRAEMERILAGMVASVADIQMMLESARRHVNAKRGSAEAISIDKLHASNDE